ncbi:MAG: cytochrome P460 family protein [Candidatus Eremiobacteraeota bacterium]|nr:cytochrome P460 family protein [Candidatus Eremiobacteraeota bacterium]
MKFWIVAGAAAVSLGLAFAAGHDIHAQLLGQTSEQATVDPSMTMPPGYRDWPLISVAAVGPPLNDLRAKLGNDIAMSDLRQATIPYRDGAIIARLAWKQTTDDQTSNAFRLQAQQVGLSADAIAKLLSQSFVAGGATNVQFMVKDSNKYASTGGWGFAQFTNGKPDAIVQQRCFACHEPAKATDFVFTHYSP